ncbi:TolC family protein [Capnocytophaga catalasegens]|uniref:Transporter n=1 Tax=Capnocytophaga catalasegens TaxID=1004260 RepID=A0AAV5AXY0_9FLAO|nr:TolC family protein [Capnocytophaga catalasegens]GIZ15981.1 transporter [Capnocytophaga catalasegens]GJM50468.1 transporter [Capnocytophaga catalasegens]GJM53963.1 transporter [Capnocytophaga catalasegens]
MKNIYIIAFLFPICCFSQKKWTLEECISQAKTHNLSSRNAELSEKYAKEVVEFSRLGNIPNVGISASNQTQIRRENDARTMQYIKTSTNNSTNLSIGASAELFGGLRKYYSVKKSLVDWDISKYDAQVVRNNLSLSVIQAYVTILLNKELIASAQKQLEVSDINIEKAQQMYQVGNLTEEKLQNMLAQRDDELYAISSAQGNLLIAKIDMCNLLHITDYETFDVENIEPDLLSENLNDQSISQIVDRLPEIASAISKITAMEFSAKQTRSALYPTLSLNASYGSSFNSSSRVPLLDNNGNYIYLPGNNIAQTDYSISDQLRNNQMGYIGLSLNIPLTNVFQIRKNLKINQYQTEQAKNELEQNKKNLNEKIRKLIVEIDVAKKKYQTAESQVQRTETILFHINQKFNSGTLTISDYNIAKENLLIAQARVSSAKFEYLLKKKLLEFYIQQ